MLADDLLEIAETAPPQAVRYMGLHRFTAALPDALRYVLTPDAVHIVMEVAHGRPSSIQSVLPVLQIGEPIWMEMAVADERRFREAAGLSVEGLDQVRRLGYIGFPDPDRRGCSIFHAMTPTAADPTAPWATTVASPVGLHVRFDGPAEWEPRYAHYGAMFAEIGDRIIENGAYAMLTKFNAKERQAARDLIAHCEPIIPDSFAAQMLLGRYDGLAEDLAGMMRQAYDGLMPFITTLAILQSRNAVTIEKHDLSRLNAARKRNRKRALLEPLVVSVSLTQPRRIYRSSSDPGGDGDPVNRRGALVSAHLKNRSSGIYLWRTHFRRGTGHARSKTVIVRK